MVWGSFWGLRGLGAHICQEDDQAMEIWSDGLRSVLGHSPCDFGSESLFYGLFSDFGPWGLICDSNVDLKFSMSWSLKDM